MLECVLRSLENGILSPLLQTFHKGKSVKSQLYVSRGNIRIARERSQRAKRCFSLCEKQVYMDYVYMPGTIYMMGKKEKEGDRDSRKHAISCCVAMLPLGKEL